MGVDVSERPDEFAEFYRFNSSGCFRRGMALDALGMFLAGTALKYPEISEIAYGASMISIIGSTYYFSRGLRHEMDIISLNPEEQ